MDVHKGKYFQRERVAAWILCIRADSGEHKAESLVWVTLVKFSIYGTVLKESDMAKMTTHAHVC